jgi:hypothetical protein
MQLRKIEWAEDRYEDEFNDNLPQPGDGDMAWLGALVLLVFLVGGVALVALWGVYQTVGLYLGMLAITGMVDGLAGKHIWRGALKIAGGLLLLAVGLICMGIVG